MAARKKSGFTLIELLVVIAIIAILAAILFPVFARAREAARKSTCQSNMKECAIALQTYWNDYDATLPSSVPADPANIATGYPLFATMLGVLPPGISGDPKLFPVTWPQMLYNSMKTKDIMFCPSDSADHSPAIAAAYSTMCSYWWKYAIDTAWRDANLKCRKEGDFGYNADQIVLYERAGFHSGNAGGLRNDVQINVVYLDTHVKSCSLVNNAVAANGAAASPAYGQAAFNGEPNFFNFDNNAPKLVGTNPPTATTATTFIDPRQYSDMVP